jgi:hypothetical protein
MALLHLLLMSISVSISHDRSVAAAVSAYSTLALKGMSCKKGGGPALQKSNRHIALDAGVQVDLETQQRVTKLSTPSHYINPIVTSPCTRA